MIRRGGGFSRHWLELHLNGDRLQVSFISNSSLNLRQVFDFNDARSVEQTKTLPIFNGRKCYKDIFCFLSLLPMATENLAEAV